MCDYYMCHMHDCIQVLHNFHMIMYVVSHDSHVIIYATHNYHMIMYVCHMSVT